MQWHAMQGQATAGEERTGMTCTETGDDSNGKAWQGNAVTHTARNNQDMHGRQWQGNTGKGRACNYLTRHARNGEGGRTHGRKGTTRTWHGRNARNGIHGRAVTGNGKGGQALQCTDMNGKCGKGRRGQDMHNAGMERTDREWGGNARAQPWEGKS